jgi:hypothetical protein
MTIHRLKTCLIRKCWKNSHQQHPEKVCSVFLSHKVLGPKVEYVSSALIRHGTESCLVSLFRMFPKRFIEYIVDFFTQTGAIKHWQPKKLTVLMHPRFNARTKDWLNVSWVISRFPNSNSKRWIIFECSFQHKNARMPKQWTEHSLYPLEKTTFNVK